MSRLGVEKWFADELEPPNVASAPVGQADETDTAFALGSARPADRANETDTALALGNVSIRATGRADETDTALALAALQIRATGLAAETDTAFALAGVQLRAVGRADETDSALALAAVQKLATGRADETDTAFALAPGAANSPGIALETDTAFALAGVQIMPVGMAVELDFAFELTSPAPIVIPGVGFQDFAAAGGLAKPPEKRRPRVRAPKDAPRPREKVEETPRPVLAPVGIAIEADEAFALHGHQVFKEQRGLLRTQRTVDLLRATCAHCGAPLRQP